MYPVHVQKEREKDSFHRKEKERCVRENVHQPRRASMDKAKDMSTKVRAHRYTGMVREKGMAAQVNR